MDVVNLLIKPSSLCNLRCKYCFYLSDSAGKTLCGDGLMTEKTLRALVRKAFSLGTKRVIFAFQGGEPTMAGLPFFERFIELVAEYKPDNALAEYSIQSNGTLLDEKWAEFFVRNNFLVGISLDGNSELHNTNRVDPNGKGTFNRVSAALTLMLRRNVDVNILCVVTGQMARRAEALYAAVKKIGCRFLQFIPCLDPQDEERGQQTYSLTPQKYAVFLKKLFDLWYTDWANGDYVSVRLFDDYVHILAGRTPSSCASSGRCGKYLAVESDGGVYPCDFYTYEERRLGNIENNALSSLLEQGSGFANGAASKKCADCKYFNVCRGGCMRDHLVGGGGNYYCEAFYDFFDYAIDRLMNIAELERQMKWR